MEYLCNDCPRRCGAARTRTQAGGVCLSPALPRVVRAAPHFGEEPCISGTRGSTSSSPSDSISPTRRSSAAGWITGTWSI